jgi:NAD-dependent dihydropyrimidine dehydrogenase PreA subunit
MLDIGAAPLRPPRLEQGREDRMTYVISEACIGIKDASCVDVCPVDCIHPGEDQYFIDPDECIECAACEPECPVNAIFAEEDVPEKYTQYTQINADFFLKR